MNKGALIINSEKATKELRNILYESKGKVLDDNLLRKIEDVYQNMEADLKKRDAETINELDDPENRRQRGRRANDKIIYAVGVGLCLLDKDLKIVWANKTICDWLGFDDPPVGSHCHNVYMCREVEGDFCPSEEIFNGGEGHMIETWITSNNGHRIRVQHVSTPITNAKGEVDNVLLLTIDVTEREKFVQRLLLLQELSEVMQGTFHLDKLLHLILTCVTTGYAFGFNRAMLFMVNKEQNTLNGKMAVGPSSPEEADRIWQELSNKHSSLKDTLKEIDYSHNIDTTLNTMTKRMSYPLADSKEVITTCIEERKTIIIRDTANDPRVTEEFRKTFGANELVCVPLIVKDEPKGVIVADNIFTGEPITDDLVNVLTMFANQAASAIENVETYKSLEDKMDQLTKTQQRLIHSEKLAAVGSMAAYVAHEIRNPLVTIGGFAKSLSRFTFDDPKMETNLNIITEEVRRLEKILNNFTDLDKSPIPEKIDVNISGIIESTCLLMENYLQEKHINLHKEYEHDIPSILVDPVQIKQVFLNLLMNAIESMPDGGNVTVKIKAYSESIEMNVIDTGKGMSQKTIQKIFDPFFTTKSDGTGVGLAVSLKIIEDHGGSISAKSRPGKGTNMTISLPLN